MLGSAFFRDRAMDYGNVAEMPPADWCVTTLHTLTNKYEHLTSARKANPPFAEAVLNNFKSKLLNVVSLQPLYDSDSSDAETEWPLGNECSYMDMKTDNTSNYLSLSPAADSSGDYSNAAKADEPAPTGLLSPSLSPENEATSEAENVNFAGNDDMVILPPSIEEALRRFLANNSSQVLSDTFTTFAASGDATPADVSDNSDKCQDDDDDAQFISESGSCSPESLDEPPEYLTASDPVDIFVKSFSANGSWEAMSSPQPADGSLTPCKRKRNTDKEDQQAEEAMAASAKPMLRNALPVSPRKRSRSASHSDAVAAVPSSASATVSSEQTSAVSA
ncbi:hypothetical protein H4R22_003166 [Coemansia sp. RSA 1290]|nr:hypothetical protein H4R22_003166 [Coemansia sp. RSA 1290]KAJ2653522.1 hypothetical protein IWW40_000215 [Coemansia sp. RSA 1250]